jgi:hypothetical protein
MTSRPFAATALTLALCLTVLSTGAQAAVVPLASYNTVGGAFTGEVDVTANGSSATFVFRNTTAGGDSSLASIWFESGFAGIFSGADATLVQTGVNFNLDVPPLSGGNNNPPPAPNDIPNVSWTSNFAKLDRNGAAANGINPGEELSVAFAYSGTEAGLVGDLLNGNGSRRIALHLISAGNGECGPNDTSCSIGVSAVPLPPALWLFLTAVFGLGAVARRRIKPAAG